MITVDQQALLILDYDGTLAPFVKERDKAYPYPGVMERLKKIGKRTRVILLSGRALKDLIPLIDPHFDELWGCHGAERLVNGNYSVIELSDEVEEGLEEARRRCEALLPPSDYEVKPVSIAVHRPTEALLASFEVLAIDLPLEVHHFTGGFELRPDFIDKGFAIRTILKEAGEGRIAYLGDDHTDEDAFEALGDRGLKVLVGGKARITRADKRLKPPGELLEFLDQWMKHDLL